MDCPVCKEAMIVMELDQVEIDFCLDCRGIWLDSQELEMLLEEAQGKDSLLASFKVDKQNKEDLRSCPICLKKMDKVICGNDKKILIDKCKKEHGLWFDSGELEDIISIGNMGKDSKVLSLLHDIFGKKV